MATPIVSIKSTTQGTGAGSGELSALYTGGSTQYNITRYPLDLGVSQDVLHWVTFYINLPEKSKYNVAKVENVQSASQQNIGTIRGNNTSAVSGTQVAGAAVAGGVVGAVQGGIKGFSKGGVSGAEGGAVAGGAFGAAGGLIAGGLVSSIDLNPKLKRIKEVIAIYMPDTVVADYGHSYVEESLTEALGKLGQNAAIAGGVVSAASKIPGVGAAVKAAGGDVASVQSASSQAEAAGAIAAMTGQVNPSITDFALKSAGASINPQVELMFKGTRNREFIFQFTFVPKTAAEADSIKQIITTFKRYAAPEFNGDQNGRYFINPAQFDIQFFFNGKENINLNKISTCVLENIMVNYSPGQFATFNDGMPAQIVMQLRFKEADIIYRELIDKYGY